MFEISVLTMPIHSIPYSDTGYFSKLICDYLTGSDSLRSFYNRFPDMQSFKSQIEEKSHSYTSEFRKILVDRLYDQYKGIETTEATKGNIDSLLASTTFTITTGHQLNLFTGPLYFIYKIFSVINLTEKLNMEYKEYHFVPVFWMATEDHDFDEINYFNLFKEKIQWDKEAGGAVGELSTDGLELLAESLKGKWGESKHAKELEDLFIKAYVEHDNLEEATRWLGNQLFSKYGLVIIDGNDPVLKKQFSPYVEKELNDRLSFNHIKNTTSRLIDHGYKPQVNSREINLFYLSNGTRERLVKQKEKYLINGSDQEFTLSEIREELENHPERFSPNVVLRPIYQEVVLPNLCYIGGGGELAYWFQLVDYFKSVKIPFPILLLRNSALLVEADKLKKLNRLAVDISSLFLKQKDLLDKMTHEYSEINIDFSAQKEHLKEQFSELYIIAKRTDPSFFGAVAAQEKKQLNGLVNLEKRLLKAQRKKHEDQLNRLTLIQDELFPGQGLQERYANFSEFYSRHGDALFTKIKRNLDPLDPYFTIIQL